jgi:amino acid adenylation domain-containing protein
MLGYFINTTPFMTSFEPEMSCEEAIKKISNDFKQHASHYKYPVSLLPTYLRNNQFRESGNPFYKISVNILRKNGYNVFLKEEMDFESFKVENPNEIGQLKLHRVEGGQRNYAVDDIVFHVLEDPDDMSFCFNYEGSRYKRKTIERLIDQVQSVLIDIVANPEKTVGSINTIINSDEILKLAEPEEIDLNTPSEKCIPDFIHQWRNNTPDNIALRMSDKCLTYLEMDEKVNSYANLLIKLGINRGDTVGIHLNRSLELSALLMGIMRAGAVYLPLDPTYPIDRLKYMAEDASVKIVITEKENQNLWDNSIFKMITSTEFFNLSEKESIELPSINIDPDDLAYIIYTSGSTGKPKGVEVSHRGAINLAYSQRKLFNTSAESNILGFASISFDASVWEMLMAFGSGATFVSASRDEILPGEPLKKLLENFEISNVTLPPSVLAHLPEAEYPDLTTIIVAGEACSKRLVKIWSNNRNFYNAYGPTETTVCATVALCTPDMISTPIGRPIGNTRVYVLDQNNSLVAPGLVGELHVSGPSLAKGYRNKPDLTEASFIKNPWGEPPFDRLYKTGDLVRWNSNDQLEYVGRVNTMIKLRGYRIELGEIESTLLNQKDIIEAVIKVVEIKDEEPYLAAYVVLENGNELDRHKIKVSISKVLPEYMIPAAYVKIGSLPLTPSGKIDKDRLPLPIESDRKTTTDIIHVSNSYEMVIAEVWKAILNLDHVGKKDNFFDLGGHSLLLLKTQDLIQKTLKVQLSTTDLFKYPTVETLAEWIQKLDMQADEAESLSEMDNVKEDADRKAADRKSKQKSLRSRRLKSRK